MQITINGTPSQTEARSLAELLAQRSCDGPVATAVNEQFIPNDRRADHMLQPGDRVEILAPMQGG